jgi:hypothetical protein
MQQMRHGTMLDADRRPDETPPATGGHADGAHGPQARDGQVPDG